MSNQSKSSKSPNMPRSGKDDPIEFSAGFWVMKEFQSVIAFRAYESVVTSGESRSVKQLQNMAFEKYHGDLNNADSLGLAKKFMLGLEMFDGIYDTEDDPATGKSKKVLKYILHLNAKATIVSDPNPQANGINMLTLSANKKSDRSIISGSTIWDMGKKVEMHGRKVLAYVMKSKYKSGKIPSGERWEDYLKFCRYKMYQDSIQAKNKNKRKATDDDSSLGVDAEKCDDENEESSVSLPSGPITQDEEDQIIKDWDNDFTFPGYMAWALWGFIPMEGLEAYKACCFSTGDNMIGKKDSSSGRRAVMNQSLQRKSSAAKQKPETFTITKEDVSAISDVLQNTVQTSKHEFGIQIFERMLDEVNKEEETWKALVLARPEVFDDPTAFADWYPFQRWKAAEKKKENILKEMHGFGKNFLHGETAASAAPSTQKPSGSLSFTMDDDVHVPVSTVNVQEESENAAEDASVESISVGVLSSP